MDEKANTHLAKALPSLQPWLEQVGPIAHRPATHVEIPEAVTSIVIGQMLSGLAAKSIYERVCDERDRRELCGSWELDPEVLVGLGLSRRKAKAINDFADIYRRDPGYVEGWRGLTHYELRREVTSHWGLGAWSADILAIFYIGLPDVLPENDATLRSAIRALNSKLPYPLEPHRASPYRTYLSLFLWRVVDLGYLRRN